MADSARTGWKLELSLTFQPHILFVLRPPVEIYPPSVNQANILVEQGFQVSVAQEVPFNGANVDAGLSPDVKRYYTSSNTGTRSLLGRLTRVALFRSRIRRLVRQVRPEIVVAFDAEVAHSLGDSPRNCGARLVWHFHEVPESQQEGYSIRFANRYVWRHAHVPDLIVFPDPGRASVFAQDADLDAATIRIVANCPRPIQNVPQPLLREALGRRLPAKARVIMYHGAVGPDHGLELAVRSLPRWPSDTVFVIKGRIRADYAARLGELIQRAGVGDRVILFDPGFQTVHDHYAMIAGADVGWTVLEPVSNAWKYSALASNKRFECMALGVPLIADQGPLLPELIEGGGCGLCIPHDSDAAAAAAVNRMIRDDKLRQQMGKCGRQLHLNRFNYDEQFKPALQIIQGWFRSMGRKGVIGERPVGRYEC